MTDNVLVVAYIGLGSNLDTPVEKLQQAKFALDKLDSVTVVATSGLYASPPMGPQDQPDYVNAALAIKTTLEAITLLHEMQAIETQLGRIRTGKRWGPRTVDLDLLLFGQETINRPELIVPHPGLISRSFVLYPLNDIAPDFIVPGFTTIAELMARCPQQGLKKIQHSLR